MNEERLRFKEEERLEKERLKKEQLKEEIKKYGIGDFLINGECFKPSLLHDFLKKNGNDFNFFKILSIDVSEDDIMTAKVIPKIYKNKGINLFTLNNKIIIKENFIKDKLSVIEKNETGLTEETYNVFLDDVRRVRNEKRLQREKLRGEPKPPDIIKPSMRPEEITGVPEFNKGVKFLRVRDKTIEQLEKAMYRYLKKPQKDKVKGENSNELFDSIDYFLGLEKPKENEENEEKEEEEKEKDQLLTEIQNIPKKDKKNYNVYVMNVFKLLEGEFDIGTEKNLIRGKGENDFESKNKFDYNELNGVIITKFLRNVSDFKIYNGDKVLLRPADKDALLFMALLEHLDGHEEEPDNPDEDEPDVPKTKYRNKKYSFRHSFRNLFKFFMTYVTQMSSSRRENIVFDGEKTYRGVDYIRIFLNTLNIITTIYFRKNVYVTINTLTLPKLDSNVRHRFIAFLEKHAVKLNLNFKTYILWLAGFISINKINNRLRTEQRTEQKREEEEEEENIDPNFKEIVLKNIEKINKYYEYDGKNKIDYASFVRTVGKSTLDKQFTVKKVLRNQKETILDDKKMGNYFADRSIYRRLNVTTDTLNMRLRRNEIEEVVSIMADLIKRNTKKEISVIDAKANVGVSTIIFKNYFDKVFAFEENELNFAVLSDNIKLHEKNSDSKILLKNDNPMNFIASAYTHAVYFDTSPWIGEEVTFNGNSLTDIIQETSTQSYLIVIKVPLTYNHDELINSVQNTVEFKTDYKYDKNSTKYLFFTTKIISSLFSML